jgi:small subunit ribosomal protein S2
MSQLLRPWPTAARCSFRRAETIRRRLQTTAEMRLETPEDWLKFREKREERKTLSAFSSFFSRFINLMCSSSQPLQQIWVYNIQTNTFKIRDGLHKPPAHATTSALLAAGAHFGHASTRMNPNFVPYAYGTRAGITIIDLDQTLPLLRRAANLTRAVARAGGIIVFIGTRPDLRPIVNKASERMGKQAYMSAIAGCLAHSPIDEYSSGTMSTSTG